MRPTSLTKTASVKHAASTKVNRSIPGTKNVTKTASVKHAFSTKVNRSILGTKNMTRRASVKHAARTTVKHSGSRKVNRNIVGKAQCAPLDDPVNAGCVAKVIWASETGRTDQSAKDSFRNFDYYTGKNYTEGTKEDFQKFFFCRAPGSPTKCGAPPCSCSNPPCNVCFSETATTGENGKLCGPLLHPNNSACALDVAWASVAGWNLTVGRSWYHRISAVANVTRKNGTLDDYQRLFYCEPPAVGKACGLPPCSCTAPPCHFCPVVPKPWDPEMDLWGRRFLTEDEVLQSLEAEESAEEMEGGEDELRQDPQEAVERRNELGRRVRAAQA